MPQILAPTAEQTSFVAMTQETSAYVHGCPTAVIANVAKRVVTDLCDRAHVWREYGAAVPLVAGDYQYTLSSTTVTGEVIDVVSASTTVAGTTHDIVFRSLDVVKRSYPSWPVDTDGDAQVFTKIDVDTVALAPVPDTAGTMTPYVCLRPTAGATVWPTSLYRMHARAIFHGVLHDLMMMVDRPWSDDKKSLYHGKQWTYLLSAARIRADRGFNTADVSVTMVPMA